MPANGLADTKPGKQDRAPNRLDAVFGKHADPIKGLQDRLRNCRPDFPAHQRPTIRPCSLEDKPGLGEGQPVWLITTPPVEGMEMRTFGDQPGRRLA
jgi:hypothetical protein